MLYIHSSSRNWIRKGQGQFTVGVIASLRPSSLTRHCSFAFTLEDKDNLWNSSWVLLNDWEEQLVWSLQPASIYVFLKQTDLTACLN